MCPSHKGGLDVVRVGRAEKVHDDCYDITLEHLVEKSIFEERARSASPNELARLLRNAQRRKKHKKPFTSPKDRREFYDHANRILLEADIVICTLNFSGSSLFEFLIEKPTQSPTSFYSPLKPTFNAVIVDEASQCLELESLIPLRFNCNKVIQVGDPEQLPATVLSQIAQANGFGVSLFERTYRRFGHGTGIVSKDSSPIQILSEQFRMHPEICAFPSQNFYDGRLVTAELVSS